MTCCLILECYSARRTPAIKWIRRANSYGDVSIALEVNVSNYCFVVAIRLEHQTKLQFCSQAATCLCLFELFLRVGGNLIKRVFEEMGLLGMLQWYLSIVGGHMS